MFLKYRPQGLLTNIRLSLNGLARTNTEAYFASTSVTKKKVLLQQVAEVCPELMDQLDLRVQQVTVDPKDLQVPRASKVMKVPLVSLVCKANEVSQEDKAHLENKGEEPRRLIIFLPLQKP
jgi:hypothetical protein